MNLDEHRNLLEEKVSEVYQLRQVEYIDYSMTLEELEMVRSSVRRNIDAIESILNQASRLRSKVEVLVNRKQSEFDLAWDKAVRDDKPKVAFGSDMVAPRERYAAANLKSLKEKQALEAAQEYLTFFKDCEQVIRTCYRGLDGYRLEVLSMIKNRSVPTSAEMII